MPEVCTRAYVFTLAIVDPSVQEVNISFVARAAESKKPDSWEHLDKKNANDLVFVVTLSWSFDWSSKATLCPLG